jgi:hypothetical protein
MNKKKDLTYYNDIIDQIESVRSKNNVNWMNLVRLAFKLSPPEATKIVGEIYNQDKRISDLAKKLTE